MASDLDKPLIISDLSGGRNGIDSPTSDEFPADQCVEAVNIDFRNGGLGRRRGGSVNVVSLITGSGLGGSQIRSLFRHDPGQSLTAWEMWMFDASNNIARLPTGTVCSNPGHPADFDYAASAGATGITAVSFNGKFYLFYTDAGGQDKNKVYDSVGAIRYVGITTPAAPTAANQGAGAYAATQRWYRVRFLNYVGGVVVSRSEPGASVTIIPSGAGASIRVTKPTTPTFSTCTHWEIEASPDGVYFYCLVGAMPGALAAPIAVATTTYDDTAAVSSYSTYALSHPAGTYTIPNRAKFAVTDGNRLVMGNLSQFGKGSRVLWTPVLGSLDNGDDERVFETATIKPYIDLNDRNGGELTGMGQLNGVIYPFKMKQIWRMTPTTSLEAPYIVKRIKATAGAVNHKCIAEGEDAAGNPCLYFMSHKGPYRVGPNGVEYLGRDLEDVTRTKSGLPNINTGATVIAHSVFHEDMGQWWLWFATGSQSFPDRLFVLDVKRALRRDRYGVRGGWTEFTGAIATATCSAMGPYTLAATVNYRPWIGTQTAGQVFICDRDDVTTDAGTTFLARIKTRSVAQFGKYLKVGDCFGIVRHGIDAGVTLDLTVDCDYGVGDQVTTSATSKVNKEVLVPIQWDGARGADALSIQIAIAEAAAQAGYWDLVQLKVPLSILGEV